jgi:hypothetical protein
MNSGQDEPLIAALRQEVAATALEHSGPMTAAELGSLLEYEWERAGLDRDSGTSLVAAVLVITAQSVREVPQHPESPEIAAWVVCDGALRWAAAHRLASRRYAHFVGLIAAAVIRALLGDSSPGMPEMDPNLSRQEHP